MTRRGFVRAGIGLAAVGVVAVGVASTGILGAMPASGGQASAEPQDADRETVAVERRTLTIEETLDGTLGYTGETQVLNGLAGTLTRLPELGAILERGDRLTRSTASGGPSCCTATGRRGGPSSPTCRTAPT